MRPSTADLNFLRRCLPARGETRSIKCVPVPPRPIPEHENTSTVGAGGCESLEIWSAANCLRLPVDSTVLIPLLFPMQSEFEDLRNGGRVRVLHGDVVHMGTLFVTHVKSAELFGLSIQFGPSLTKENFLSCTDGSFVTTGHAGLPIHHLTLDEVRRIQRTGDQHLPYALEG